MNFARSAVGLIQAPDTRLESSLVNMDARNIGMIIGDRTINTTITSPPYFNLKNYQSNNQIGYGQSYSDYLDDLCAIFSTIYDKTADDGSLWIVIDTFRRDGAIVPLPFDMAGRLSSIGWFLKDIIIWRKDRTLPWSKEGATRNIFEYILVFAKSQKIFKYFPDRVREYTDMKHWWVRYPERYNPKGKSLEEVWDIGIPVQGSWSSQTPRHLCPFPPALVRRIIKLSSDVGDLIVDPFAGTGVVLEEAQRLGRRATGCELDPQLVDAFSVRQAAWDTEGNARRRTEDETSPNEFEKAIINLRTLKFARLLLRGIRKALGSSAVRIVAVPRPERSPEARYAIACADYYLIVPDEDAVGAAMTQAEKLMSIPPLSKFGLEATVSASVDRPEAWKPVKGRDLYGYTLSNTHRYSVHFSSDEPVACKLPIISTLGVIIDEHPDY